MSIKKARLNNGTVTARTTQKSQCCFEELFFRSFSSVGSLHKSPCTGKNNANYFYLRFFLLFKKSTMKKWLHLLVSFLLILILVWRELHFILKLMEVTERTKYSQMGGIIVGAGKVQLYTGTIFAFQPLRLSRSAESRQNLKLFCHWSV